MTLTLRKAMACRMLSRSARWLLPVSALSLQREPSAYFLRASLIQVDLKAFTAERRSPV